MRERPHHRARTDDDHADRGARAARLAAAGREHIHVRNHDHQWGYDLSIEVVDPAGDVRFEKRYYLLPGQVETELDVLPAGEYELRATLDNLHRDVLRCRIDDDPANTAVIEFGNGALSLTHGRSG